MAEMYDNQGNKVVITTQPGYLNLEGNRDWSSGLCSCFDDCSSCALTFFCGGFYQCYIASKLNEFILLPMCVPGASISLRSKLRYMFGIRGSICDDCLMNYFCGPCVLCQMAREMKAGGILHV